MTRTSPVVKLDVERNALGTANQLFYETVAPSFLSSRSGFPATFALEGCVVRLSLKERRMRFVNAIQVSSGNRGSEAEDSAVRTFLERELRCSNRVSHLACSVLVIGGDWPAGVRRPTHAKRKRPEWATQRIGAF